MTVHSPSSLAANASSVTDRTYVRTMRALLVDVYQFTRFSVMGCTVIFPILGAATTADVVTGQRALLFAVAAISFHVFAYVLNDVIDLPIDRTEPLRAADPLVRGIISQRRALAIALMQLPLLYALATGMGGEWRAYAMLSLALAGMVVYNWYGKKTRLPFVTDVVQGIAWASFAAFGASFSVSGFTVETLLLGVAIVVYIVMINGVHGALRDLGNDRSAGARTTAMMLGARNEGAESFVIPKSLQVYAAALQLALIAVCTLLLAMSWSMTGNTMRVSITVAFIVVAIASIASLIAAARRAHDKWGMVTAGMFHLFISFAILIVPLAANIPASVLLLVLVAYVLPVAVMLLRFGVRWG